MVLTARNRKALEETRDIIMSQSHGITVRIVTGDLNNMESLSTVCLEIMSFYDSSKHDQGVLVHNAATMNEFVPFLSQIDPFKIQSFLNTNVTSMIVLTTQFLSALNGDKHYVIHITANVASQYSKWFTLYSVSKAARTAFMGSLKEELPDVRQLNYSPGPCDTDMLKELPPHVCSGDDLDDHQLRLLTAEESISKMVGVLKKDEFENGCTIDFFDRKI